MTVRFKRANANSERAYAPADDIRSLMIPLNKAVALIADKIALDRPELAEPLSKGFQALGEFIAGSNAGEKTIGEYLQVLRSTLNSLPPTVRNFLIYEHFYGLMAYYGGAIRDTSYDRELDQKELAILTAQNITASVLPPEFLEKYVEALGKKLSSAFLREIPDIDPTSREEIDLFRKQKEANGQQ